MRIARTCDLLCVGEALVDLYATEGGLAPRAGGSAANVAAWAARTGARAAIAAVVGADSLGDAVAAALDAAGVDTRRLRRTPDARTGLCLAGAGADGGREVLSYRQGTADGRLAARDLPAALVRSARILYLSSAPLAEPAGRRALEAAVRTARHAGVRVAFDANAWPALFGRPAALRAAVRWGVDRADLLKLSERELATVAGRARPADFVAARSKRGGLVVVTLGERGAVVGFGGEAYASPGRAVPVVEPMGAGDAYFGTLLALLAPDADPARPDPARLGLALAAAQEAGALAVQRIGAFPPPAAPPGRRRGARRARS